MPSWLKIREGRLKILLLYIYRFIMPFEECFGTLHNMERERGWNDISSFVILNKEVSYQTPAPLH